MEHDDERMLRRSGRIHIDAPAATVWSVLTDISGWPGWMPDVRSAEPDGPFAPGLRFSWRSGPGVIRSEVLEAEPHHHAVWRGRTMGIEAVHSWRLAEDGPAGAWVETHESWSGLLPRVLPGYFGRMLDRALVAALAALRTEAERRAGQPS